MKPQSARLVLSLCAVFLPVSVCGADEQILDTGSYQTPAGDWFAVTKGIRDGKEFTSYRREGRDYTPDELRAYEHEHPRPVADRALLDKAAKMPVDAPLVVTVWLAQNPGPAIVRAAREEIQPQLDALTRRACDISRARRPAESMDPAAEKTWVWFQRPPANRLAPEMIEHRAITREYEALKAQARAKAIPLVQAAVAPSQGALDNLVATLGGKTISRMSVINGATIEIPAGRLGALAVNPMVARVYEVPPVKPELDVQKLYLGHTTFWADGYDGGIWDPGILDSGIQQNHPTFGGINFVEAPGVGTTDMSGPDEGHGTAVASIVFGRDGTFTGIANAVEMVLVGRFAGANVQGDAAWMVDTTPDDPECINLSGGYGVADDVDYSSFDQFFDALIDNHFCGLIKSTGNEGDGTTTITHPAPAYNTLSVANMNDFNTSSTADDRITSSSSRGPTLAGRFKPDISAPGNATAAANNDWATAADWINFGGTSSAAPHVCGGMILLTDQRSSDDSKSNKAILLNTADTWSDNGTSGSTGDDGAIIGSEWNKTYGWGYLDLSEANFNAPDLFTSTVDDNATGGTPRFRLYKGTMFNGEKATLVWNRHVGWNGSSLPTVVQSFTDLDLYCYRQSTGATIDFSTSVGNNVEQIAVAATESVVLRVYCFNAVDADVGTESFALATEENFTVCTGPVLTSSTISSFSVSPGQNRLWEVEVTNSGDVPAHNVTVNLTVIPAGWTIVSGADPQNIGTIPNGGSAIAQWTIRGPCDLNQGLFTRHVSSFSYGTTWEEASDINTVFTPSIPALGLDLAVNDTLIPRTYSFNISSADWSCVGIGMPGAPSGGADHDVQIDDDMCKGTPYQSSTFGGLVTDFVLADGRNFGSVTHYARAYFGSNGPYNLEHDQALDISVNTNHADAFSADEPIELYEALLVAGRTYRASFTQSVGAMDASLHIFRPDLASARRSVANWSRDATGAGGSEVRLFQAPVSGAYAFVIANDNHNGCTFTFRITCGADFDQNGVVNVADIFAFLAAWFANNPSADFLQNGVLNVADIFDFLTVWFSGC